MWCRRGSSQNSFYGRHSDKLTASLCNSGPSTSTDDPTTNVSVCLNKWCKNRNCWCLRYVVRPPAARWRFGHVVRFPVARWRSVDWFWRRLNLAGGTDFGTEEWFWQEPILVPDFPLSCYWGWWEQFWRSLDWFWRELPQVCPVLEHFTEQLKRPKYLAGISSQQPTSPPK